MSAGQLVLQGTAAALTDAAQVLDQNLGGSSVKSP
jgi:hypothetical protein